MKIKLDIDCTPEEARAFLGLPDTASIQEEFLQAAKDRMVDNLKVVDPEFLFQNWMNMTSQGLEEVRNTVFGALGSFAAGGRTARTASQRSSKKKTTQKKSTQRESTQRESTQRTSTKSTKRRATRKPGRST